MIKSNENNYFIDFLRSSIFQHHKSKRFWNTHVEKKFRSFSKFQLFPPEQRTIVAKIEELFSDLDKGIADLKKAQDQLKVYRQAVLKKAFEGELTIKSKSLPIADVNTGATPKALRKILGKWKYSLGYKWCGE